MDNRKRMADAIKKTFAKLSAMPSHEVMSLVESYKSSELAGLLSGKSYSNTLEAKQALHPKSICYDFDIKIHLPEALVTKTHTYNDFYALVTTAITKHTNVVKKRTSVTDWDSLPVIDSELVTDECLPVEMANLWLIAV